MAFRNMNDICKYESTDMCMLLFDLVEMFYFPLFNRVFVHFTKLTGEAKCWILS